MQLYSTRSPQKIVSLQEAVLKGLAEDGGLFMPTKIPKLGKEFINNAHHYDGISIATEVARTLLGDAVPSRVVDTLVEEAYNFSVPLVEIEKNIYSLELFHGQTMAFKDVGARFIARLMSYFNRKSTQELNVIVATSGDTGSAVAAGFYKVKGINVFILYPKGKVSPLQEKQLTTWGENITALEVDGTFDDCQRIAKTLLSDIELNQKKVLTSANSINIARLIPQSFYYAETCAKLMPLGKKLVYSVPSGNFGNLTGGLIAQKMGFPIHHFVAATNANDVVPQFLKTNEYQARPSVSTISNAMDVGAPSNFERLQALFGTNAQEFLKHLTGYSFQDTETEVIMQQVFKNLNYTLDPHGAIGYLGLKKYLADNQEDTLGVFLETAHPAKFIEVVERVLNQKITIPEKLQAFADKEKISILCPNDAAFVKNLLLTV